MILKRLLKRCCRFTMCLKKQTASSMRSPRQFILPEGQIPLKSTPSKSSEGIRQLDEKRGSLPVSARLDQSVSMLPVMFISLTGCVSCPVSIRNPSMPYEKSCCSCHR